jgi:phosphoribosyl 1,2-cyclic phosphodiesterase
MKMFRFVPLCSSSKGNCVLIEYGGRGILIDAGMSCRSLTRALHAHEAPEITAILVTHEHSDHVKGLNVLAKQLNVPVFASMGTIKALQDKNALDFDVAISDLSGLNKLHFDMAVRAFHTSHDSAESVGYVFDDKNGVTAGVCTDSGRVTIEASQALSGCDLVYLESNYDPYMLKTGSYPMFLKRRIQSDTGHLSNDDSANFSTYLIKNGTKHLILAHLSEENNTPLIAKTAHVTALQAAGYIENRDYTLRVAAVVDNGKAAV